MTDGQDTPIGNGLAYRDDERRKSRAALEAIGFLEAAQALREIVGGRLVRLDVGDFHVGRRQDWEGWPSVNAKDISPPPPKRKGAK